MVQCVYLPNNYVLSLQERDKDRLRFQRPPENARDHDRGGSSAAANRVQDLVGVMSMASSMMGGSMNMNLAGGNLNNQLLNQLGIDPSMITNQVFVANVSSLLSYLAVDSLSVMHHVC